MLFDFIVRLWFLFKVFCLEAVVTKKCSIHFLTTSITTLLVVQFKVRLRKSLEKDDRQLRLFDLIKHAYAGSDDGGKLKWKIFSRNVCREGFLSACGISDKTLGKMEKAIRLGHLEQPEDQRQYNGNNPANVGKELGIDAFFSYVKAFCVQ